MDKGLTKINELTKKIKEVQQGETQNNSKIADIIKAYEMLMIDISLFEERNSNLNEAKTKSLAAPQKRKKEKKELIKAIILGYIVTTLIGLLVVFVGSGGSVSIINCILSSLTLFVPTFAIAIPIEFKNINKKYPISDTSKIETEILSNNNNLQSVYSKKTELDNLLNNLREKNENYNEEINKLQKEIDSIVSIRASIIEEFCNNNSELDKKLDDAYDKSNIKEKIK